MPVSMEESNWGHRVADANPLRDFAPRMCPVQMQCHACGYEPDHMQNMQSACPKCGCGAWDVYPIPGALLLQARRPKPTTRMNTSNAWAINTRAESQVDSPGRNRAGTPRNILPQAMVASDELATAKLANPWPFPLPAPGPYIGEVPQTLAQTPGGACD